MAIVPVLKDWVRLELNGEMPKVVALKIGKAISDIMAKNNYKPHENKQG